MMKNKSIILYLFICFITVICSTVPSAAEERLDFNDRKKNIGIYLNEPKEIEGLEIVPDIIAWFDNWYGSISTTKLDILSKTLTSTPFITWQPKGISLEEIASGAHDDYIKEYLEEISKHAPNIDILVRFAHEMEMRPKYRFTWYSWQEEENPDIYIQAWRHVVEIGRKINPDILWVWSPNRSDKYSEPFYPGDDYVDYVGITLNLRENHEFDYDTFTEFYEEEGIRTHLESYGKNIIITEVAYSNENSSEKVLYLRSIFDHYLEDPKISGIVFFNDNIEEYRLYRISDNETYMSEFTRGIERILQFRKENGLK